MRVIKERYRRPLQAGPGVRIRPVFDDFHRLRMEGDHEYPAHRHSNYELILVGRGPYRCRLNEAELSLHDGEILVVQPGDEHQDHLRDGQEHYVVHFRLATGVRGDESVPLFRPDVTPEEQISRGDHAPDALLVEEIRREAEDRALHAPAVQDCLLEALFWRTVRGLAPAALSPAMRRLPEDESAREQISAAMLKHLRGNPNITVVAAQLGVSPRHLANRCRDLFGESPARLLLRLKVKRAEEMLRHEGRRVKEVSEALGFANPYHFSRVFRRITGRAPSQA
jgi:AraC-like DNA-binding protein